VTTLLSSLRLLLPALVLGLSTPAHAEEQVHIYNWSDYFAENTLPNFQTRTGIRPVLDVYDSNEVLEAKLFAGSSGYDLIFPTARPFAARHIKAGLYQPLDTAKLSGLDTLDPDIMASLASIDLGGQYLVPYMWGTSGLGVNVEKVAAALGSEAPLEDARHLEPWQDPRAAPYVRIERVTKKFGDLYAVDDVSLNIFKGEFFSLLGSSGCGKSTLLRLLAGLDYPSSGRIYIDGADVTEVPPYSRPVNMMFQSYALFPHMTVEQNVEFGLKQDRVPKKERQERVGEMLDLLKIAEQRKRRPEQLSGGQRQRVALARSLA